MTKEQYFKQLAESQEQYNKAWDNATKSDIHLSYPLGWL